MSIFKKNLSKKTKLKLALAVTVVLIILAYLIWDVVADGPLTTLFSNRQKLIDFVESVGLFGPVIFILLQVLQTIVAPIPANVVGLIGGLIFGWWGVLWTTIGLAIGSFVVFIISRTFGQPLVEKIFKKDVIKRFDFLVESNGSLAFFIIFLIPGLPDDIVCYLAGLTKIPISKLMLMIVVGRMPAIIMTNMLGNGVGAWSSEVVFGLATACVLVLILLFVFRERVMKFIRKFSPPKDEEEK